MTEDVLNPSHLRATADLRRTGFQAVAGGDESAVSLRLQGELDMSTAPSLGRDLSKALDSLPQTLTLDLSELTFLDSTGIRVLVSASLRARADGCAFILRSPQGSVLRVLQLTGVDRLIIIEPSYT